MMQWKGTIKLNTYWYIGMGNVNNGHEFKMEFSHVLVVHVIVTKQYMYYGPE